MGTWRLRGVFLTVVSAIVLVAACSAPTATPTSAPAAPAAQPTAAAPAAPAAQPTTAPAASAAQPTAAAPAAAATKTLKIAFDLNLQWPLGADAAHLIQLDVDATNAAGGLQIGPDKYKIDMAFDDHKGDQAAAKTVAQKEIFQDGVKFILGDQWDDGISRSRSKTTSCLSLKGPP